jgi:lipopolysaccharide heptosyltransferase I
VKISNIIKNYLEFLFYFALRLFLPNVDKYSDSLLLLNTGEMGDLIISSVILENPLIFQNYKNVIFIIKEPYIELFAKYNGKVKFIGYNYKKYKISFYYKLKFLLKIRKNNFRTAIQLTAARGILSEEIIHLSGAEEKIVLNTFNKYLGTFLCNYFNKKYNFILTNELKNEYEKHFELLTYLKDKLQFPEIIEFNRKLTFPNLINKSTEDFIVLAPFSSLMNRDWPQKYFAELISELKKENKIILIGSERQKSDLLAFSKNTNKIEVLAGDLNFSEIPNLLIGAKCFVGLDSGITHLAIKLNIPTVALIGGGEYGRFFPYRESDTVRYLFYKMECFNCNWNCYKDEMYCLTEIKPKQVFDTITNIINK